MLMNTRVLAGLAVWHFGIGIALADDQGPVTAAPATESPTDAIVRTLQQADEVINAGPTTIGAARIRDYRPTDPNRERIEAALDEQVAVEFIDTELAQVMQFLSERYQVPIVPDVTRLTEVGVDLQDPVNLVISGITLRNALDLILDVHGLDVLIEDEVLKITSAEHAAEVMEVRVYELRHLPAEYSSDGLGQVIRRTVQPESWIPLGDGTLSGPTSTYPTFPPSAPATEPVGKPIPLGRGAKSTRPAIPRAAIEALPGCLIVRQSQRAHREIATFLESFERFALHPPFIAPTAAGGDSTPEAAQTHARMVSLNTACNALQEQLLVERRQHAAKLKTLELRMLTQLQTVEVERDRQARLNRDLDEEVERLARLLQKTRQDGEDANN